MSPTYHRASTSNRRPPRPRSGLRGGSPGRALATTLAALALCAQVSPGVALASGTRAAGAHSAAAPATLVIDGAGDGHGVGMSQEGALGYAQHGCSYQAILAHYYTATTLGTVSTATAVRVLIRGKVHRIPLETYVRGVVGAEMPASWPPAALEAQAVASRTYALTDHAGGARFDVYADTRSQVYLGAKAATAQTNAAVAATAGQVVLYGGQPAITYFFASSGGETESVQNAFPGSTPEPWLQAVADPYDQGPLHDWSVSMSFAAAAARLRGLVRGSFRGIEVLRRGSSPRIVSAEVLGSAGRTPIGGPELAARLGLDDTWAYFSIRTARGLQPEPDLSGHTAPPVSEAPVPTPSATTPASSATAQEATAQEVSVQGGSGTPPGPVGGTQAG
jgi:SpoIID/LytB domain protein